MPYGETKVYFDGSHYIAIPHTTRPSRPRRKPLEEEITVVENAETQTTQESAPSDEDAPTLHIEETDGGEQTPKQSATEPPKVEEKSQTEHKMTRKELFNKLYAESLNEAKAKRRKIIVKAMRPYFKSEEQTAEYIDRQMERKYRNLVSRRIRLLRKVNLHDFNYFVTFTYDNDKHTEDTFRKKLKRNLSNNCDRKSWKYIGVWERSPEKKRLHFHGIFSIPDGAMQGELIQVKDYSLKTHKMQITIQNTYFNDKYGRSDFEPLDDKRAIGDAVAYILKYIEKTGEKIVYSRGLPQFFISDVMDEDVVCSIGLEDKKLLLFDDFICFDEGEYIGKVSPEAIKRLRKCN